MQLSRKRQVKARQKRIPRSVLWRQVGVGLLIVVFLAVLLTGIWYGTRIAKLTITDIAVIGGETIPATTIIDIAEDELGGTYYRLVPRHFAWMYPEERIRDRILTINRIKNVHVERTSGTSIAIAFEEYRPFALWCDSLEGSQCAFLDRSGFAFAEAPELFGSSLLRLVKDDEVIDSATQAFPSDLVQRIVVFAETGYQELGLNVVAVEVHERGELTYHLAGGGEIQTSLLVTLEETVENLATVLSSSEFVHLEPGNFRYIDLRFGNKVFVNEELQNSVDTGVSTATATTTQP